MMQGLAEIYDLDFFREWGRNNPDYVFSAELITEGLCGILKPRRIADVGCGCGVYGHFFAERGVSVVSIDGIRPPAEQSYPIDLHLRDITEPFENVWGEFDFALCLEVAEHIPEELADPFLANLGRLSDTLVLSAAPPNQGGTHHVNERPKRYWVERLARHGFAYNRRRTGVIVEHFKREKPRHMWMGQHICVYERAPVPR